MEPSFLYAPDKDIITGRVGRSNRKISDPIQPISLSGSLLELGSDGSDKRISDPSDPCYSKQPDNPVGSNILR